MKASFKRPPAAAWRISGAFLILHCVCTHAILPLPYPTEAVDEEAKPGQVETQSAQDIPGYAELFNKSKLREMELPSFDPQPDAIGYSKKTFEVPKKLKSRVDFWKRIYSEFTSDQAVLHDSVYPDLIYGVIDVGKISRDPKSSYRKKMRSINRILKQEKRKIADHLATLQKLQREPAEIPVDLFPLFRKFEHFRGENKFKDAKSRLRAQVGQRDRIVAGFLYGGRYFKRMMQIFEEQKVPKELTRLPLVESAFNLAARSKVGASGVWQFMRSTGKRYMRIDRAIDERNDPISATWAAAALLRQNYETLGNWPLAITAYNHGREGMARAVKTLGTDDIGEIVESYDGPTFGFASSNFYSEFLAIVEIEKEYRKYFGKLVVDSPLEYDEVPLSNSFNFREFAKACDVDAEELAALNPALTEWVLRGRARVPVGYVMKVPPGAKQRCATGIERMNPKTSSWRIFNRFTALPSSARRNAS